MNTDLKVAIIQADLVWENIDKNLENFTQKINQINESVDLIILPEMFTTGFSMNQIKLAEPTKGKSFECIESC